MVNPYDVAFREARSAVGAAPLLASAREFAIGRGRRGRLPAGSGDDFGGTSRVAASAAAAGIRSAADPPRDGVGPVALLFGSEKFGLSNEDLAHCHWLMRISTAQPDLSMNLGQAVAVCLYELVRDAAAGRAH